MRTHFAGGHFIDIAPDPVLPRLDGAHQWMLGLMEVLSSVLVLGRVATSDVPALQAHAQMYPGVAGLYAILADVLVGFRELDLIQMSTCSAHNAAPIRQI